MDKIIGKLAEVNNLRNVIDNAKFNDEEKMGKDKEKIDRSCLHDKIILWPLYLEKISHNKNNVFTRCVIKLTL